MKAKILEKNQEEMWDKFVGHHPLSTIHQTIDWGAFQTMAASRNKKWIIGLFEGEKLVGGTMLIRHKIPKGFSFLYASRGPLLNYSSDNIQEQIDALMGKIKHIAKEENAIFLRIDPPLHAPPKLKGFHPSHTGFYPENTQILDLTLSEQDLLSQMKPKGRYNIRLAEKKGVTIRKTDQKNAEQFSIDVGSFHSILQQTTERDGFSGHPEEYYLNMLSSLVPKNKAELYLAEFEGKIIAGVITTTYGDTTIYYYGASSNEYRNLMAPYLLQWEAIKDAKKSGCKIYDFLGIAPPNAKNHPWKGVTDFKLKFGGQSLTYSPCLEHPTKPILYILYRIYKRLQK